MSWARPNCLKGTKTDHSPVQMNAAAVNHPIRRNAGLSRLAGNAW
ncbi:MAG: hypothetical protein WKF53_06000 [Rubrobacter sp.]